MIEINVTDITEFNYISVEWKTDTYSNNIYETICPIETFLNLTNYPITIGVFSSGYGDFQRHVARTSNTKITISHARLGGTTYDSWLIVDKIYGMK